MTLNLTMVDIEPFEQAELLVAAWTDDDAIVIECPLGEMLRDWLTPVSRHLAEAEFHLAEAELAAFAQKVETVARMLEYEAAKLRWQVVEHKLMNEYDKKI